MWDQSRRRTITCWGNNLYGQTDAPGDVFTDISAGSGHLCGIKTDGTITCWGNNLYGQTDAPGGCSPPSQPERPICVGSKPTAPSPAGATTSTGKPMRLGGVHRHLSRSVPFVRDQNRRHHHLLGQQPLRANRCAWGVFTAISAGGSASCGIKADGTAQCWDWTINLPPMVSPGCLERQTRRLVTALYGSGCFEPREPNPDSVHESFRTSPELFTPWTVAMVVPRVSNSVSARTRIDLCQQAMNPLNQSACHSDM